MASEYDKLRAKGLTHQQVMRRLSPKTLAVVEKANIAAAKAAAVPAPYVAPTVAPTVDYSRRAAKLLPRERQAAEVATPYIPEVTPEEIRKFTPEVITAEVGDTFGSIAKNLGIPVEAIIKANKRDTTVKAGAVYNVPQIDITGGVGAGAGIGEDLWEGAKRAWEWLTPQDESADETFREWALAQPGGDLGGGLQNIIREGAIKLGDFIRGDDETGVLPASKPLASPARKRSVPPRRAEYADFRRAEAEAAAKDAYTERESQFMTGTSGITDIADLAETKYAPAPGPQVGFDFQWENSSDLYMALNEQTRAIYNAEPMYRIEKYGAGLLGLHLYEDQGKLDVVSQLGFEPWVKPFTVNYLNQFPGTNVRVNEAGEIVGDVDWNYIDDDTIRRLEDLGFIAPGGGTTDGGGGGARVGGGGGGGGGGGSVRYASSGYAPRGDQLYNRGSQLALVSWSI